MTEFEIRKAAIDHATAIVEKLGSTEVNSRGYKVDGWKPMTGPERADAIVKIASFLVGPGHLVSPIHDHPACPGPPECTYRS